MSIYKHLKAYKHIYKPVSTTSS